jgi:hypothetical protein
MNSEFKAGDAVFFKNQNGQIVKAEIFHVQEKTSGYCYWFTGHNKGVEEKFVKASKEEFEEVKREDFYNRHY